MKVIRLPIYNMVVTVQDKGGAVTSDLIESCPYCGYLSCNMECPEAMEALNDRDPAIVKDKTEELSEFRCQRAALDAIQNIVLAHAVAGIDIESPAYLDGIETAVDSVSNTQ
jgi:hypothetical protein